MKQTLRICLVSAAYPPYPSGVSEHVIHLAKTLKELGQEVEVLTTRYPGKYEADPIPVTRLGKALLVPLNRSYATLPVGFMLPAEVKHFFARRHFDIVNCHGIFWPEISYWAIRYSNTVNVVTFLTAGFKIHTEGAMLFYHIFRKQLARIQGLIAISNRASQAFKAYVPGKPEIIPCGVDLNRFRPGLSPLPEPKQGQTILFLGRLDARKGIEVLLKAMPEVLVSIPKARLIVVGKGPREKKARNMTHRLGLDKSVRFIGSVERQDLPHFYAGCDVYCSPALGGETLGIVLLEAMACGVPVVASSIPGYDETIRHGIDGLLCPPGKPDAFAKAIIRLIQDRKLSEQLIANGLDRVRQYAWPVIGRRTLDYYREILASRSH